MEEKRRYNISKKAQKRRWKGKQLIFEQSRHLYEQTRDLVLNVARGHVLKKKNRQRKRNKDISNEIKK